MKCPKCDFINPDRSEECRKCGVIFAKITSAKERDSAPADVKKSKPLPRKSFREMYKEDAETAIGDMIVRYFLSAIFFIIATYLFVSNHFSAKWHHILALLLSIAAFARGEAVRLGLEDYDEKRKREAERKAKRAQREAEQYIKVSADGRVQCSKCGCSSIVTIPDKKQSGLTGGVMLSPFMILSGGGGDYNLINVCQNCGHRMRFRENISK